ncbi:hypothetical protein RhiJN_05913 [Ceratobasidium sp. AG-Ba]|nr:hypothetical protein RhiJN_05913 [Ceratobasidium sp. AG-Ba]
MHFPTACIALVATAAAFVAGSPVENLSKRETSYGNPDLVTDQGNRFKLNFGSTNGHPNACRDTTSAHGDVSLGNPDDFVDEGNRWRLNYGSTSGHPNACDGHYICYIYK